MPTREDQQLLARRAELLAEMFLNDLGARVTEAPSGAVDYLAFFESSDEAFQVVAVEVKARETPIPAEFPIEGAKLAQVAKLNIPTLLLVVDIKQNKFGFAWLDEFARTHPRRAGTVKVPIQDAEQSREQIRERILSTAAVSG